MVSLVIKGCDKEVSKTCFGNNGVYNKQMKIGKWDPEKNDLFLSNVHREAVEKFIVHVDNESNVTVEEIANFMKETLFSSARKTFGSWLESCDKLKK